MLQPIIVRPVPDGGFELVAGERRWRAARQAGQSAIPALMPDRTTWLGRRDHALLLTAIQTGLRVSELCGVRIGHIRLETGASIHVHGKRRKQRVTPLTPGTVKVQRVWLRERQGAEDDPLFPTRQGGH